MLKYKIQIGGEHMAKDVSNLNNKVQLLSEVTKKTLSIDKKYLVHSDYYENQVLVNEKNEVSAILDIGYHAVAGDRRLDVAGVFFYEEAKHYTEEHIKFLLDLSIHDYGVSILKYNDIYRMYYCFYFSDVYNFWPEWVKLLIKNLNDENIWKRINKLLD